MNAVGMMRGLPELNLESSDKRRRRRTANASEQNVFEATLMPFRTAASFAEVRACVAAILSAMTGAPLQVITALPRNALSATNQLIALSLMGKTIMLIEPGHGPVVSCLQELEALDPPLSIYSPDVPHLTPSVLLLSPKS